VVGCWPTRALRSAHGARCPGNKSTTLIDVRLAPTSGAKAELLGLQLQWHN
jgi:hypothetical protein